MGLYFNPDNESFKKDTDSRIYIDKTGLIDILNKMICTSENCVALSHARRFGKTQAAGMIDAYYSLGSDSKELFSGFEIAKSQDFEKHLNKYNVIHIDVSSIADFHKEDLVKDITRRIYDDLKDAFADRLDYTKDINEILGDIYLITKIPFIIIIDEWDYVVRNRSDRPDLVHEYLQFLHAIFKSEESKRFLALGYITGILPVKKIEDESALNNFFEYTMMDSYELTKYFGFTEGEVKDLCSRYGMDFESIRKWYDGYNIGGTHMYNPNSVYQAMVRKKLDTYWKNTSAFGTINRFITMDYEGLKDDVVTMLEGGKISVNTNTFQNDLSEIGSKDEALTGLIHLGYLGYDSENGCAYIPNFEVSLAYHAALQRGFWGRIGRSIARCDELLQATIAMDCEKVAEMIELAHEAYTPVLKYNDENSLSCVLSMAYFTANAYYHIIREFPSGKGFADLAFIPMANAGNRPAMIIELKYDKSADSALQQIKEKRYAGALAGYSRQLLLVGINYDKRTRKYECRIEAMKTAV